MRQHIESIFPKIVFGNCLESESAVEFEVFENKSDNDKRSYIRRNDSQPCHLKINNPSKKEIHFLAIDDCMMSASDPSRCDCALFDDTTFCFVEIETASRIDEDHRTRNKTRKEAQSQLEATIQYFRDKGFNSQKYELEALICLARKEPHPAKNATNQVASVKFQNAFNASLLEGNSKTFL